MSTTKTDNKDEGEEIEVKVYHILDGDKAKPLGELIASPTGRRVIVKIKDNPMILNHISKELEHRVSNIVPQLKKLIWLKIINIIRKQMRKKTKDHNYNNIKFDAILILIEKEDGISYDDVHKYNILKKMFKPAVKLSSVIIAGAATWIGTNILNKSINTTYDESDILMPILFTGIVIGFGLFIIYYSRKRK